VKGTSYRVRSIREWKKVAREFAESDEGRGCERDIRVEGIPGGPTNSPARTGEKLKEKELRGPEPLFWRRQAASFIF